MNQRRYSRRLQGVILRYALYRGDVHADDVRAVLPVPEGIHPNIVGRAFIALESAGLIAPAGFERSRRRKRHSGISRRWRVVDAAGARAYLRALAGTGDDVLAGNGHAVL